MATIVTIESHPHHVTVGRYFKGKCEKNKPWERWRCITYDGTNYGLRCCDDPSKLVEVSKKKLQLDFYEIHADDRDHPDYKGGR